MSRSPKCRGCGARIIWMKTRSGVNIPVEYEESLKKVKIFDFDTMKTHFAFCPDAIKFRRKNHE